MKTSEEGFKDAQFPYIFGDVLGDEIPEIEIVTRTLRFYGHIGNIYVEKNEELILEEEFYAADPAIFRIFSIPILHGSSEDLIADKRHIAISKSIALKYFGVENAIGFKLMLHYKGKSFQSIVRVVYEDLPWNSTMQASMICNMDFLYEAYNEEYPTSRMYYFTSWSADNFNTYIKLKKNSDEQVLIEKAEDIAKRYFEAIEQRKLTLSLQNLREIYLNSSDIRNDFIVKGSVETVQIYLISLFVILLITTVNYVLLYTSLTTKRLKEIGVRKVFGANNRNLVLQFGFEAIFVTMLSMPLVWILFEISNTRLSTYFFSNIQIYNTNALAYFFTLFVIIITIAVISGTYISIIISRFNTIDILKNLTFFKKSKFDYKLLFFAMQVFLSLLLLNIALIIYNQMQYGLRTPYGFNKEQILNVYFNQFLNDQDYKHVKASLSDNPVIESIAGAVMAPPSDAASFSYFQLNSDPEKTIICENYGVNSDFFKTLQLKILYGRAFDFTSIYDLKNSVMINYSLYKTFNFKDLLKAKIKNRNIIGIIQNFNYHSFYMPIRPSIYIPNNFNTRVLIIRTSCPVSQNIKNDIIEKIETLIPGNKIVYIKTFNEQLRDLYQKDIKFNNTILLFTFLSIFLTFLGLIGMILHTINLRRKEIGIRRILGASKLDILLVLIRKNVILTIVCGVAASILAYVIGEQWLNNFVYTTGINILYFPLTIIMVLLFIIAISFYTAQRSLFINLSEVVQHE